MTPDSSSRFSGAVGRTLALSSSVPIRYALAGTLAVVVTIRLVPVTSVYQDGAVVLTGNDPYAYRYAVEQVVHGTATPWSLPDGVASGEPLLVSTLALAALLLGGSQWAADTVVAWYLVVSALLTALLVYGIAVRASGDARIGLAAVLLLAVTPMHGFRTSIGFADHHAFDYVFLALTVYALLGIVHGPDRSGPGGTGSDVALLAVGLAGQLLAWEAGPLLVVPLAFAIGLCGVATAARDSVRPLSSLVAGVAWGTVLTGLAHVGFGWQDTVVVLAAGTLFAGSLGVLSIASVCQRLDRSWILTAILEVGLVVLGLAVLFSAFPDAGHALERGIDRLLHDTRIGEMSSLTEDYGLVLGPLVLLGFGPFLALPGIVLGLRAAWRRGSIAWPILIAYGAYFAVLTAIQRRFGGELAPFLALLGGLGLLGVLGWLDLAKPHRAHERVALSSRPDHHRDGLAVPDRTRLTLLGGAVGVFAGSGALYTTLINDRLATDRAAVRAARWIDAYASERGWEYPENYVLSEWGRNRMFNYFVNGQSASYGYARRYYEDFLFTSDAAGWYEHFDGRVGFIVVPDLEYGGYTHSRRLYARLRKLGSATENAPGLGHYRAVYASPDRDYLVFTLVPGATLSGTISRRTRIETEVSIPGADFEYVRFAEPDDGSFSVTVAHPGTYTVDGRSVVVTERDVRDGRTLYVGRV
ncbi:hypothetical protein [Halapricum hydrolyticum]|uniref:Oligosaccharyl transferase n=1 Tax=Halapricum hydrolyticum TaxID=2979991 RepID=A0AAE3I9E8_9EURY|nr:hypothetical protein [Halapricum hydrolyticum]MCU4718186.1 hypothetical protein [Halapricum hydrolyticum]MCU4726373.1 hypothetical protein [Halapricum hydrolyticum]